MSEAQVAAPESLTRSAAADRLYDGYWSEEEYAAQRGVSLRTVQRERARGIGAPFTPQGRRILYRIEAVREWLLAQEQKPKRVRAR